VPEAADDPTAAALDRLVDRVLAAGTPLRAPFDPDWRSPCESGAPVDGTVSFRPLRREPTASGLLDGLAAALGRPVPVELETYYGRYWSGDLELEAPQGPVALLLLWNEEDADRLAENLLGHALQQRRLRRRPTLFFACTTADSDRILSLDEETREVVVERPGTRDCRVVAPDLASFLDTLMPPAR
jgi:SecY interacting protein Syd